MKKAKRIFALAGAVILIALYLRSCHNFLYHLLRLLLLSAYFSIFTYGQRSGTWIIWCIFRMHIYHPGRLLCLHSSLQTQP